MDRLLQCWLAAEQLRREPNMRIAQSSKDTSFKEAGFSPLAGILSPVREGSVYFSRFESYFFHGEHQFHISMWF